MELIAWDIYAQLAARRPIPLLGFYTPFHIDILSILDFTRVSTLGAAVVLNKEKQLALGSIFESGLGGGYVWPILIDKLPAD